MTITSLSGIFLAITTQAINAPGPLANLMTSYGYDGPRDD